MCLTSVFILHLVSVIGISVVFEISGYDTFCPPLNYASSLAYMTL